MQCRGFQAHTRSILFMISSCRDDEDTELRVASSDRHMVKVWKRSDVDNAGQLKSFNGIRPFFNQRKDPWRCQRELNALQVFLSGDDFQDSDTVVGLQWTPGTREELIVGVMGRGIL